MNLNERLGSLYTVIAKDDGSNKSREYELTDNGKDLLEAMRCNLSTSAGNALSNIKDQAALEAYMASLFCAMQQDGKILTKDGNVTVKSYNDLYHHTKKIAKDFYSYNTEFPFLLGEVMTYLIRQPLDAKYQGMSLMRTLPLQGGIIGIDLMYFNATFEAARVVEGQEYKPGKFSTRAEKWTGNGKVGVRMNIPDAVRQSPAGFPVIAWLTESAIDAIYRFREKEIFELITDSGTILFDNSSGSYNNTSGRNSAGVCNGTFTQEDLFTMVTSLVDAGYQPNTLIMSPQAWLTWSMDPFMKMFGFWNGQSQFAKRHQGDPGNAGAFSTRGGVNIGSPYTPVNTKTTYTSVPESFPYPIDVVVSPYITSNTTSGTSTIILGDRAQLGIYVETQGLRTIEWPDPEHDSSAVKMDMDWFLMKSNEGAGIRKAQSVVYNQVSYYFGPENTFRQLTNTSTLDAPGTTAIVS